MSKSIHTTHKDLKGLTREEINYQFGAPHSDLAQLAKKSALKKSVKQKRKIEKRSIHLKHLGKMK